MIAAPEKELQDSLAQRLDHLLMEVAGLIVPSQNELSTSELEVLSTILTCPESTQTQLGLSRYYQDELGQKLETLRSRAARKRQGFFLTPPALVCKMFDLAADVGVDPDLIIEPGMGTGRFLIEGGIRFPKARLLGYEIDPLAALVARANLSAIGLSVRSTICVGDFREVVPEQTGDRILMIGNPPFVRHQWLSQESKEWFARVVSPFGLKPNLTANLYAHFFAASVLSMKSDDLGVFLTPAEWLYNDAGQVIRDLFLGPLGGISVDVLSELSGGFPSAMTTLAISAFQPGVPASRAVRFRTQAVAEKDREEETIESFPTEFLSRRDRWPVAVSGSSADSESTSVSLGELFSVRRGLATGSNKTWLVEPDYGLLPTQFLKPVVSRAREVSDTFGRLVCSHPLKKLVSLPRNLDDLSDETLVAVQEFIRVALFQGVPNSTLAKQRKVWWSIPVGIPPSIMSTYMRRGSPLFCHNNVGAASVNIAHGLYPLDSLSIGQIDGIVQYLNRNDWSNHGRKYAKGLVKCEPSDIKSIRVPLSLINELRIEVPHISCR